MDLAEPTTFGQKKNFVPDAFSISNIAPPSGQISLIFIIWVVAEICSWFAKFGKFSVHGFWGKLTFSWEEEEK